MRRLPVLVSGALAFMVSLPVAAQFHPVREIAIEGQRILIDNTNTRLAIEVIEEFEDDPEGASLARGLYQSYAEAAAAAEAAGERVLPSVALVYAKGKKFDDGTYAAVELAAEEPIGRLQMGKPEFITTLLQRVIERGAGASGFSAEAHAQAMSCLGSALAVGGDPLTEFDLPDSVIINERAGRKPIGFYTWNDELAAIFRRDTALQERCDPAIMRMVGGTAIVSDLITSDPELLATYDRLRRIYARLTNRMVGITARDVSAAVADLGGLDAVLRTEDGAVKLAERFVLMDKPGFALLEASESKEGGLLLMAATLGLSSMDAFIEAIRSGDIDLAPDDTSGWYEHQQYALEPLLMPDQMPEGRKLELGEKYRKLLEEHFKSMIADIRETHIKQEPPPAEGAAPGGEISIEPYLAAEPTGTTYLRFARAYGFLHTVLTDDIGPETLNLRVLDEGARPRPGTIGEELDEVRALMSGAHLLTCRDLGVEPDTAALSRLGDMNTAEKWLANWRDNPDMARDVRMMIPVARMPDVYWAVIGVRLTKIGVRFEQTPEVRAADGSVSVEPSFEPATYWVPTEQFLEIQVDGEPLSREEFRELCDEHRTEEAIRVALPKAIASARISRPATLSGEAVPVAPFRPAWYVARPWMIWVAAGGVMALILLIAGVRWARGLRAKDK